MEQFIRSPISYLDLKPDTKILIQSGKINLTSCGIPPLRPQCWLDDDKREFMKIPYDDLAITAIQEHIERIEAYLASIEPNDGPEKII